VAATAASAAWPVFDAPEAVAEAGKLRIGTVVEFAEGEVLSSDDFVLQVRRPGHVRVRVDYVKTMARYRLTDDGHLEFDRAMNLAVRADQTLTVVAHDVERRKLWVWLGDGSLVAVDADCCHPVGDVDTLLWLRLATGPAEGKWMMAPESGFRPASWEEHRLGEIAAGRPHERPRSYPRMGGLGTRDTVRPVVAGARLTIWRRGLAEDEPVFVVHGSPGLGSAYLRLPLTETLGQDRQLFLYDQRGSGYSEGADDRTMLTIEQMVNDLDLLRQRAELEQIDLLAHGFGGLVALRYVLLYPHRVRRLVLIEPEPGSYGEWAAFLDEVDARQSPADRAEVARYEETRAEHPEWTVSPGMEAAILGLRTRAYTVDPAAADRIDFALTDYVLDNWAVTRDALRADLGGWDLHASVSTLSVPTLIVAGDYGALAGAERLHDSLHSSELVVMPGVGHYPFVEAPEQFAQIVLDFLRRTDP